MPEEIHLINPLWNVHSGAELRTVELYRLLSAAGHNVHLWTEYDTAELLLDRYPISRISLENRRYPVSGNFVFVGHYFKIGDWFHLTRPNRIILIHNTPSVAALNRSIRRLSRASCKVEIVFVSKMMRRRAGLFGPIDVGWLDLNRFHPIRSGEARPAAGRFVVGRLSRSISYKYHHADPRLYSDLARVGCDVSIMGGNCLAGELGKTRGVELLPAGARDSADFLRGLDCFTYRTSEYWPEPMGRVVFEAMACGLPVVCHVRGGYAEKIIHGENGFLYRSNREARKIILKLIADPELRRSVGRAARISMESLFSERAMKKRIAFYGCSTIPPSSPLEPLSPWSRAHILTDFIDRKVRLEQILRWVRRWRDRRFSKDRTLT